MSALVNLNIKTTVGQILEFKVAFPGEKPLTVEEYLAGGSRHIILKVASLFLSFKSSNSKFKDNQGFLRTFFSYENNSFANEIYAKTQTLEKKGVTIEIINTYSSLKLFECFFAKKEEAETQSHDEFERNLFKAYLVLNSEYTKKQFVALSSTDELENELKIPMMMFCMSYFVSDKSNYDIKQIWFTQMIKSIYLFQFLETNKKTQVLLPAFLAYFNCSTWQEYLKSLIPLTLPAITNENEAPTNIVVSLDEKYEDNCFFIEKLMLQKIDELDQNDFLTIRSNPIYKINDGLYGIIFNLFVAEKIFKGVYFILRDINKTFPDETKIKSIKSIYGFQFSEKVLSYKVIESIYTCKCIKFSGKELSDKKIDGAPDYYIRKGKNIILFESKDFLILAEKKASFDFNIYEEEFQRVLYYEIKEDGKEKPGAVLQLTNSIRKLLIKKFPADTDYHYKEIFIYPVLLTHDHQYDTIGFNELVDYWFQDELLGLQEEGLFVHHVKPLTVVNIDTLIYNQVGLSKKISLEHMLGLYHENKKINLNLKFSSEQEYTKYRMSKLIPFSIFIEKYFNKHDLWELPPLLDVVGPALFQVDFEKQRGSNEKK